MRILLLLLFMGVGVANAQYAPTSAKTKSTNGVAIGSKDTSAFSANDSMVITMASDSVLYYKYKGYWNRIATGGSLSGYVTTNTPQNITSVKNFDSTQVFTKRAIISPTGQSYYQVTGVAEDGPALFINQSITNASSVNEHGIIDRSTFSRSGKAYNSYDAQAILSGTNNLDHYAGFQSRGSMQLTGVTLSNYYSFLSAPDLTSGTVNKLYHFINFSTTGTGAGGANEEYGFYAKPMSKGIRKYAFYSESDSSYFGNQVEALSFKKTASTNAKILLGAGSDIDTSTLLAGRWLPNRSLDTATALQSRIQTKQPLLGYTPLNVADTSAMLSPYARTSNLPSITGKLNISDTATMLSPYRRTSTAITQSEVTGLSTSLAAKLNISDTATMLSNRLKISDTATMLARSPLVNRFLDTATALQTRIQTKSPLAGSSAITTIGTLSSGSIPYSLLSGTVPTWNQNTTGTASNITAFTINQNLSTTSSPTFSDVTGSSFRLGNGQYLRLTRSSGSLQYDAIGIPAGTDNVRILTTNDFDVVNGSLVSMLKVGSSGAITASNLAGTGDRLVQANSSGVLSATQAIASGTYTPTVTNIQNATSITAYASQYTRIGSVVTVSGRVAFTSTVSAGTRVTVELTLPVATGNFTTAQQCAGTATSESNQDYGVIKARTSNGTALLTFVPVASTVGYDFYYTFTYSIQ